MQRACIVFLLSISIHALFAQIEQVPIPRENYSALPAHDHRTKATMLETPFWDDFSLRSTGYPDTAHWQYGRSVWVNDGLAIHPPSIGVATFDGLDSLGKPYSVNDVLAKGYADKLVSHVIRLDNIPTENRPTVFMKFFFQMTGYGETPDAGDVLSLSFRNASGVFETVWTIENDGIGTLDPTLFYEVTIPITDEKFYHDQFQIEFRNFARLSGPYDTWHLDYIFIGNGIMSSDPPPFPDRTIIHPLSQLFKGYEAIPIKHFKINPTESLQQPSVQLSNRRSDQIDGQPISYSTNVQLTTRLKGETPTTGPVIPLDEAFKVLDPLVYNEVQEVVLNTLPDISLFNPGADSIGIKLGIVFDTRDNTVKTLTEGDYVPEVYSPIDFRVNDSISKSYTLSSYYAYDDGTAEYGAALNRQGAQLAYEFNMLGSTLDTLVALDLYFPRFGDESAQVIELRIWNDLAGDETSLLYSEVVSLQRLQQNKFWRKKLSNPVAVGQRFFIGWRQSSSAVIAIGLDRNNDSGTKMYSNTTGTWVNNNLLKGSLMMRPVFGKGIAPLPNVGLEKESSIVMYPNPSSGIFSFDGLAQDIRIFDATGRDVPFTTESTFNSTNISLLRPAAGLYIVRLFQENQMKTTKIIVR